MVRREMVGFNEVARRSLKWAGAFRRSIAFNTGGIFVDVGFVITTDGNAPERSFVCLRLQHFRTQIQLRFPEGG